MAWHMARPLRFQGAGFVYHVMARGNNKMAIFLDALDYARFLEILGQVVADFEIDGWVHCVMPNHYHLVLRTRCANLSSAIGHLNGTYAQWWNRRHGHVGHVFQGRFKAQVVEASVYLLRLCRYVLLNPVRAGLTSHPGEWPWSSYHALTGRAPSSCVDVASLLRMLGDGVEGNLRARLLDYVDPAADPDMAAFIRGDRRIIGTDGFAAQFRGRARAASKEVPARERRLGTPSLTEILAQAVREGEGLPGGICRAHESAGYPLSDIARCAGVSLSTVARIVRAQRHGSHRPGTRPRPTPDLTPEVDRDPDLTPTSSDADRGST
jgi:putative transposase